MDVSFKDTKDPDLDHLCTKPDRTSIKCTTVNEKMGWEIQHLIVFHEKGVEVRKEEMGISKSIFVH